MVEGSITFEHMTLRTVVLGVGCSDLVEVDLQQQWLQQGGSRSEATTAVVQSLTVRGAAVVVTVDRLGRFGS